MTKDAVLSEDKKYRYSLSRIWDESKGYVLFIGLNPSTADANIDDPTIRRCIGFATNWGYGGIKMANLYAKRATDPKKLEGDPYLVGDENYDYIISLSKDASLIVAAWGANKILKSHGNQVSYTLDMLKNKEIMCLGKTKNGNPRHPLYVPYSQELISFKTGGTQSHTPIPNSKR